MAANTIAKNKLVKNCSACSVVLNLAECVIQKIIRNDIEIFLMSRPAFLNAFDSMFNGLSIRLLNDVVCLLHKGQLKSLINQAKIQDGQNECSQFNNI